MNQFDVLAVCKHEGTEQLAPATGFDQLRGYHSISFAMIDQCGRTFEVDKAGMVHQIQTRFFSAYALHFSFLAGKVDFFAFAANSDVISQ